MAAHGLKVLKRLQDRTSHTRQLILFKIVVGRFLLCDY